MDLLPPLNRFQVASDPVKLAMLGLTCMAVHENVKREQYGALEESAEFPEATSRGVCVCVCVLSRNIS